MYTIPGRVCGCVGLVDNGKQALDELCALVVDSSRLDDNCKVCLRIGVHFVIVRYGSLDFVAIDEVGELLL